MQEPLPPTNFWTLGFTAFVLRIAMLPPLPHKYDTKCHFEPQSGGAFISIILKTKNFNFYSPNTDPYLH